MTFYGTVRAIFHPIGRWYFRMRVDGLDNLPATAPAVLTANHVSWLDPLVLGSACPRPIRFLIDRRVYERRSLRWFFEGMSTIPVDGAGAAPSALRAARAALREGELVGIFPQGTGLKSGEDRDAAAGAILLHDLSGAPLVPVALVGTREAWPPGTRLPRPRGVLVRFGAPLEATERERRQGREGLARRASDLMERIRALRNGS